MTVGAVNGLTFQEICQLLRIETKSWWRLRRVLVGPRSGGVSVNACSAW